MLVILRLAQPTSVAALESSCSFRMLMIRRRRLKLWWRLLPQMMNLSTYLASSRVVPSKSSANQARRGKVQKTLSVSLYIITDISPVHLLGSLHQSWFYDFFVPSSSVSNRFYKVSLRFGLRLFIQGLWRGSLDGTRSSVTPDNTFFYCKDCELGWVANNKDPGTSNDVFAWIDPFVMYIVDVNKPAGGIDTPPPPPPQPDYPSPPPNAIPFTNNGSQIPIYYNQTVVLQCLTSGVVSPVLIIRKVDHQTTVVGGGLQEGAKGVPDHYCAPGEVCGDPVSQLHKVAFEVYDSAKTMPEPGTPGATGAFLSCMGEKVNTYRPIDGRQWTSAANNGSSSPLPGSPITPTSKSSGCEYFGHQNVDSAPASPTTTDFITNDGGRVKKSRASSSAGGVPKPMAKGRRRPSSAGSVSSRRGSGSDAGVSSGALWQVDIGETSVWTIVGTGMYRYWYIQGFCWFSLT